MRPSARRAGTRAVPMLAFTPMWVPDDLQQILDTGGADGP